MSGQTSAEWARGRWPGILIEMGVPAVCLTGKHGPCPICTGLDRFRFDDKEGRGTFFCNNCGAGDGFDLLQSFLGLDFKMVAAAVDKLRGRDLPKEVFKAEADTERRREWLNKLWAEATHPEIWKTYLSGWRGLADETVAKVGADVRGHASLLCEGVFAPCVLTMVRDLAGRPVTLHRTFLFQGVDNKPRWTKMFAPSIGTTIMGASAHLIPGERAIVVGEGIETTLAGWEWLQRRNIGDIGARAALTANGLAGMFVPPTVERIWICADRDLSFAGQAAAYELARRLTGVAEPPIVAVMIPNADGTDMLDVLIEEKTKERSQLG